MKRSMLILIAFINVVLGPAQAAPLSTAFTYQGRLTDNGQLANGTYDFQFRLFDAPTNGAQVPVVLAYPTVAVSNGLFITGLDFGSNVFNGITWWLEISLRPSGTFGEFTLLAPRQQLTATPNALFSAKSALAATATTANGVVANAVSSAQLNTPAAPVNGEVLSYNGRDLVWTNAPTVAASWKLNGNAGIIPGVGFLGTTDNQPLDLRVSNQRGLRLELGGGNSVNVIGGWIGNGAAPGAAGATAAGGGAGNYFGASYTNRVDADFGTVSGGGGNTIQSGARFGTISGGVLNTVQTNSTAGIISGGNFNTIRPDADYATIGGGSGNVIQTGATDSTIGGGNNNTIQLNASHATIGGGNNNIIQPGAAYATIGGGFYNTIQSSPFSTLAGGAQNIIQTNAPYSNIGGGNFNTIESYASHATINGGHNNTVGAFTLKATIGGGSDNLIQTGARAPTIGGGMSNVIQPNSDSATIGGGEQNTIQTNSPYATIPGGRNNSATDYAFAAGFHAKANHTGSFVWADFSSSSDFLSSQANEFTARATGGVRFVSGVDNNGVPVAGVSLPAGSGSWATLSDRNAKTHFTPVDPRKLLDRLTQLPIQSWNYKSQSELIHHIGPVAQDFYAAFTVGEDDQHIASVDADGVALAAIQGLNQKLEERLKEKEVEMEALKQRLEVIEKVLVSKTSETGVAR